MIAMRIRLLFALSVMVALPLMSMARYDVAIGSKTIVVPTDFLTIQEAINNAAEGDTIFVRRGAYVENVIVNRTVSLVGEDKSVTFIDGGGVDVAIRVSANNVSISGFTIENGSLTSSGAGIVLYAVSNANLADNVIVSSYSGVILMNSSLNNVQSNGIFGCNISLWLNYSSGSTLRKNTLANSSVAGVYLHNSPSNAVLENNVTGCDSGVILDFSGSNTLRENDIVLNKFNFDVNGAALSDFAQDIDTSNKVDGGSIYYFVNANDVFLNGSALQDVGYLAVVNSSNVRSNGLRVSNNGEGFLCAYSADCITEDSSVSDSKKAASFYSSTRCSIINDSFVNNVDGVSFVSSVDCSVKNSIVLGGNGYGLKVESSGNSVLDDNVVRQSVGGGINVYSSPNCNVTRNTVVVSGSGILVQVSANASVISNAVVNNTGDGIYFSYSENCTALGNNVNGNGGYGMVFKTVDRVTVYGNYVGNNTKSGIYLYTGTESQIDSNVVNYNEAGIRIQACPSTNVNANEVVGNANQGVILIDSGNSTILSNTILDNGLEGLSLQNSGNSTADENTVCGNGNYGIWLQDSPKVNILGSNVSFNTWDGIYLRQSNYSKIVDSVIDANGEAGSRLYYCDYVTFARDSISGNKDGLRVFLANNNTISDNTIMGNLDQGINIFNSTGNSVFHNIFMNNTVQALSSESTDFWDGGYPSGGNYWSDYVGVDFYWGLGQNQPGSDSLGDTPYVLDSGNSDRYPLMTTSRFHGLALERVALPSNEIYEGWVFGINATVKNTGGYVESFNITAYYGDAVVATCFVGNLTVGKNYTASLTWNTSSLRQCQVNDVKAEAISTETSGNNAYSFGVVKVKMVGDVNGDGKVNILDIAAVATGFGRKIGDTGYKLNYDMNLDYVINIVDISLSAKNYSKTCP